MKVKTLLLLGSFVAIHGQIYGQSCRDLFRDANQLVQEGKLEKAKTKYQQVVNCGDNFYLPDSKEKIKWIDRVMHKPNKAKPFAISENEIVIPYQGGQDVITVDGEGSWTASVGGTGKDWCKIKREKGKVYVISDANENSVDRTCEISISMGGKTKKVKVKNDKAPEMLISSVENVTFPSKGETNTVDILSNTDWKITEAPGWVITSKEDGKVTLTVQANGDNKERKAEIKIESTSKAVIINIYQGAGLDHLAFSKNDLHFGPDGGDEYLNVYTDADDWGLGDFPSWCQVTKMANNLLRIHCTPNDPINLNREASVNVTTGKQTLGVNVNQEAKPFVAVIPSDGIGGHPISFGVNAGFVMPIISASADGFTGGVVNYALGNENETASYSSGAGFTIGAFADIRIYRNVYLIAGLNFLHYSYTNKFDSDVYRQIYQTERYYQAGNTQNNYEEKYTISQLEMPILLSYRLPITKNESHVQFNLGPVINYGLSAKMKIDGYTSSESTYYYAIENGQMTNNLYDKNIQLIQDKGNGEFDLFDKSVSYSVVDKEGQNINKSSTVEDAPLKRLNLGVRAGVAYEYRGFSLGVEYTYMFTNMANDKFWNSQRWRIFDQNASTPMSGYKQRNHYLGIKLGYTFRY